MTKETARVFDCPNCGSTNIARVHYHDESVQLCMELDCPWNDNQEVYDKVDFKREKELQKSRLYTKGFES